MNRLIAFLYLVSIGCFALFWLPAYLGTAGPPPWPLDRYLLAVAECQIPVTIIAALLVGLRWVFRGQSRRRLGISGAKITGPH